MYNLNRFFYIVGNNVSIVHERKVLIPQLSSSFNRIVSIKNIQETEQSQTIRCRVIIKSDKHPTKKQFWDKEPGPGMRFTLTLLDKTCEIQMTAFGKFVDQFFNSVEVDKIYCFSNFTVKSSDKSRLSIHNFNLRFTKNTRIVASHASDIPNLSFNFESIASVKQKNIDETLDVLAICERYGDLILVTLRKVGAGIKRDLFLVDYSGEIMVTIWGTNADNFKYDPGCVIAFKRARVNYWQGRKLLGVSCLKSSMNM